jgi:tetratricopeptide (TPR) repeat protein
MTEHVSPLQLQKFRKGRLSRGQRRDLVRHLLAGCEECLAQLLPLDFGSTAMPEAAESGYTAAFDRVRREVERHQIALANERSHAPELLRELSLPPFDRRRLMVANSSRFRTWALCELLLDAAKEAGFQDPAKAEELARLGTIVAERLDRAAYGAARVNDLRARAWATLANAERIRSDFRAAEKSFHKAERRLQEGSGEPLEKAGVFLLKASLLGNQQRFGEAFRLLDRVVALGRKFGGEHLCGQALITRGFLCGVANRPEEAHRLLAQGLELVDAATEPRLVVAARHNLILHFTESGQHGKALNLLEQTRQLYLRLGDRMNLLRLRWIEGKLALAQGHLAQAESLLEEVRRELSQREIGYDAALVCLDLAQIYARQGRSAEMRRLAEEMIPIFRSRQIQREALTALIIFQKAAEMEGVTLGLVEELSDYLNRTRKGIGLRFRDAV